jgi:pimeloyl-ACP methyl ester carboxylesterase
MATFVLVHGAFVGGWSWKKVTSLLRAAGHEVYTPTLTGLGERIHLLNPGIDPETHIQDILGVISYEDLEEVILVGHSYSGLIIASVADRVPHRLAHLVYLDAFIPKDGQSALDLFDQEDRAAILERVHNGGEGWLLPPREPAHYGIKSSDDMRWAGEKFGSQPFKTWQQPVRLTNPAATTVPRTYIFCTATEGFPFAPSAQRAREEAGWHYREIDAAHNAMMTAPQQLTELLLELV